MKLLPILLAIACAGSAVAGSASAGAQAVPVTAATARVGDVAVVREGLGTVQALNAATIRVQVTGELDQVTFKEGQSIKKGQLIAQIDPRPFQAQVDQTVATLAKDQALLANAKRDLQRYKTLSANNAVTQQQYDTQVSTVEQDESTAKYDEAAIEAAKIQLGFTTITAPFDGVLGVRLIDVGNIVHPNDANGLVVLTQVQPISVMFALPAVDIPVVQAALKRGAVRATVYASDDATLLDEGELILINNQADPTSGTVQLKARFPNARDQLWPGTFVNVHVTVDDRPNGVTVPLAAVQQGPDCAFVYVVGSDDVARMRRVRVGQSRRGEALIDEGVKGGDRVVTDGFYGLADGAKVAVVSGEAAHQVQGSTSASAGLLP